MRKGAEHDASGMFANVLQIVKPSPWQPFTGIFPSFNIYAGKTFSQEKELGRDIAGWSGVRAGFSWPLLKNFFFKISSRETRYLAMCRISHRRWIQPILSGIKIQKSEDRVRQKKSIPKRLNKDKSPNIKQSHQFTRLSNVPLLGLVFGTSASPLIELI